LHNHNDDQGYNDNDNSTHIDKSSNHDGDTYDHYTYKLYSTSIYFHSDGHSTSITPGHGNTNSNELQMYNSYCET